MKLVRIIALGVGLSLMYTALVSFTGEQGRGCDLDALFESNAASLQPYTFIKKFDVELDKGDGKAEYSYVFSRDSEYKIMIYDLNDAGKKMVVNFYDRNKKLIASNYVKSSKKVFPSITYKCSATGVYYVEAYFEGEMNGCGITVLGFKK